jgi:hypothetical protein
MDKNKSQTFGAGEQIEGQKNIYQVVKLVGDIEGVYEIFMCIQKETERQCLLLVALDKKYNGMLDRAALILKELEEQAGMLEEEYSKIRKDEKDMLNYQLGFPELVDSIVREDKRKIIILAFRKVEKVKDMVPIINITEKDKLRVDLRTSAWIFGKLLKLLTFAHSIGISLGRLDDSNILIEPSKRYVLVFDFSKAQIHTGSIPAETRRQEIAHAAQSVINVLGGNLKTGVFPNDGDAAFGEYTECLLRLARGSESRAKNAHTNFYELIDKYWPRELYPFTTKPLICG